MRLDFEIEAIPVAELRPCGLEYVAHRFRNAIRVKISHAIVDKGLHLRIVAAVDHRQFKNLAFSLWWHQRSPWISPEAFI